MNQITLDAALNLPDKTTANIVCKVESAELKTGPKSTYWNGQVSGNGKKAYLNSFANGALQPYVGKQVILMGCEVDSWNGRKKLTLGKRGSIQDYVADLEAATPESTPIPSRATTQTTSAPTSQGNAVHGATEGGAIALAVEIWLASIQSKPGDFIWDSRNSTKEVEAIARDIVGIQQRIESGEDVPF